jgi:hypothetical protein
MVRKMSNTNKSYFTHFSGKLLKISSNSSSNQSSSGSNSRSKIEDVFVSYKY